MSVYLYKSLIIKFLMRLIQGHHQQYSSQLASLYELKKQKYSNLTS